ncbi:MAG: acyl dehydratase [Steroidobacteraceae bacterium]
MSQRLWEDVQPGDALESIGLPLNVYRCVMIAGSNRDFNPIHHNTEYARMTGAPEMYVNTLFLQNAWERCVRDYIGLAGSIRKISGFRMKSFNTVGDTLMVKGEVIRKWREGETGLVELKVWCENSKGVSVGPGAVTITLP